MKKYGNGQITKAVKACIIESELGSLEIRTHEIVENKVRRQIYSLADEYFERKDPNKKIVSARMAELINSWASSTVSYRELVDQLNRFRLEEDGGIKLTWLRDYIEKTGEEINAALHEQAAFVLEANGFEKDGNKKAETTIETKEEVDKKAEAAWKKEIKAAATRIEMDEPVKTSDYECPYNVVNISADDVLTNRQASSRPNAPEKGQRKYVTNTVIHIEHQERNTDSNNLIQKEYVLCDDNIKGAFGILMGFLAANDLIGMPQYVFYTDGASDLRGPIETLFAPFNYKIILDWHHLMEKTEQRLSSGMKSYKLRHVFEDEILKPLLWRGKVSEAISQLKNIPVEDIKSKDAIDKLIDYLTRNEKYIPCYALRRELGLRNSSNRVEKANDCIVSKRQKNNGMSWSFEGSRSLASVTAVRKNDELKSWCMKDTLRFSFSPVPVNDAVNRAA